MAVKDQEPTLLTERAGADSVYKEEALVAVAGAWQRWEAASARAEAQAPFWKKDFTTVSGMEIPHLVTPEQVADVDSFETLSIPDEYPYTRGIHPTGDRGKLWTMRQLAGFGTAADTNARFKHENTMPLILDCVKAYCTVGEISDSLRDVFGTYEEPAVF